MSKPRYTNDQMVEKGQIFFVKDFQLMNFKEPGKQENIIISQ